MQNLVAVGASPPSLLCEDAILYSDARVKDVTDKLSEQCGAKIDPTSILAKLSLLPDPDQHNPGYSLLLGAADYVIYALSKDPKPLVTDPTTVFSGASRVFTVSSSSSLYS